MSTKLYDSKIDLSAEVREKVIGILNVTLATTIDLKTQTKQAHWNVRGVHFYSFHKMFDEMAVQLEEFVDMVAERVTALGGVALGTARVASQNSLLPEYPSEITEGIQHVAALAERYAIYAAHLRDAIAKTDELGDADTADLYTEISRAVDKHLWFLEAHLHSPGG
ncbi:MAG: DNA starvation/stationary phase protection protein Dps [Geminocystis sp.]|nr:DNA starvation/stationary phase protection protein Dps [Geminocystis sp.]HIK37634.1 DNA starvation/stationary phase protection protein Dps [Geminocystis sp. M7585_C2015_104]MCS7148157.1 DNA starvation/stationary phase protection protein Dps [Geminocystis sp.]MCX8078110.1 DNA starvation/stationary phase protection protein Dps [Geminocystis sp.]MDW8116508.1 DNA starvation/stationary phase protection protein Dps [Geminocystis sp.]